MALFTFDRSIGEETPFMTTPTSFAPPGKTIAWGRHRRMTPLPKRRTPWRSTNPGACGRGHHRRCRYQQHDDAQKVWELTMRSRYRSMSGPPLPRRRFFGADDTLAICCRDGRLHVRAHVTEDMDTTISTLMAELQL